MLSPWQLSPEDQMPMGAGVFPLPGGFDPRSPSSGYGGHADTPGGFDEQAFEKWYAPLAARNHIDPNPDDPRHFYDYRGAYSAGAGPDQTGHWPSQFKREGNPRTYLDAQGNASATAFPGGVDTRTGDPNGPGGASGYPYADEPQLPAYHNPQHQEYKPHGFWEGLENMVHGVNVSGSGPGALIAAAVALGLNSKLKSVGKRRTDTEEANAGIDSSAKVNADREEKQYGERMKDWTERRVRAIEASKQPRAFAWQTATPAERRAYLDEQGQLAETRSRGAARGTAEAAGGSDPDVAALADAIEQGLQPPETKGLYRKTVAVRAELGRRNYDLMGAQKDWQGVQRTIATLNGSQQTRLRQAVDTAYESLNVIENLSQRLSRVIPRSQFPMLNKAALAFAKGGALGPGAASVATQLEAQITDVASEIGNAYMGGNSPTDQALKMAQKNLSGDWSEKTLHDAINLARTNLKIRRNSINNTQPLVPGPTGGAPGGAAAGKFRYDPATGTLVPK